MLEHVSISKSDFDAGELAEALVYYQRVDLNVSSGHITNIIKSIGIENTIRLSESQNCNFIYSSNFPAVWSHSDRFHRHRFASVSLLRSADGRKLDTPEREITENIIRNLGRGSVSKLNIKRLTDALITRPGDGTIAMKAALLDIQDKILLSTMIRAAISAIAPSYPKTSITIAQAIVSGEDFALESNIDFPLLNQHTNASITDAITPENILAHIASMRWELYRSGDSRCDIWTSETQSLIMRAKVNSFIDRLDRGRKSIDRFQDSVFNGRSFRNYQFSATSDFGKIIDFVESKETQKFKKWISTSKQNAEILREYDKANLSESTLMKSLPFKTVRFVTFSIAGAVLGNVAGGSGLAGALTGLATDFTISKAEEMLFEQLKLGWRPNQWVSKTAIPLLTQQN